jgi:D-alanyl-D-alanine carboxypeptidase
VPSRIRSAALTVVCLAVASLMLSGAPRHSEAVASTNAAATVNNLRKQADQARGQLETATKAWQSAQTQLNASQEKLKNTLVALGAADSQLNAIRLPLAKLANLAYQQGGIIGMPDVGSDPNPYQALRGSTDLSFITLERNGLIKKAAQLRQQRQQLAATAQDLQSRNAVEQVKLTQQIGNLKQHSAQLTSALTTALHKLGGDAGLAANCSLSLVPQAKKFPNGLIPSKYLCPLPESGRMLRADAALAFYKLNEAYKAHFGVQMCLTDSYRPLAEQQALYADRPGMAAVPGRSNHGWGTAIDVCGGVASESTPQFQWMLANSKTYDFFHPPWAFSSPYEPWHWEYTKEDTPESAEY